MIILNLNAAFAPKALRKDPKAMRAWAVKTMKLAAKAARNMGIGVVNGFTGSPIWPYLYSFPPVTKEMVADGYRTFAKVWKPILDVFADNGVKFALEVHPTEIAFDIASAQRALEAIGGHPAFGFNYDPSHLGYQGVDYVKFIRLFGDRIFHVHMKDAWWGHGDGTVGVFGGHGDFGDARHAAFAPKALRKDPKAMRAWAVKTMKLAAKAARNMGIGVVNGFTGSPIWPYLYSFPPVTK